MIRWVTTVVALAVWAGMATAETVKIAFGGTPPYVFTEEVKGIEIDLFRAALSAVGKELEPVIVPVRRVGRELELGEVDGIANVQGLDIDRSKYHLSAPTVSFQDYFFTLKAADHTIEGPDDMAGLSVVTFPTAVRIYPDWLQQAEAEGRYSEVSDQISQVRMLYRGRTDAVLSDANIMRYLIAKLAEDGEPTQEVVNSVYVGGVDAIPAFRDAGLRDAFQEGLAQVNADGTFEKIVAQYTSFPAN